MYDVNVILLTHRFLDVTKDIISSTLAYLKEDDRVLFTIADGQCDDEKSEWIKTRGAGIGGRFKYIVDRDSWERTRQSLSVNSTWILLLADDDPITVNYIRSLVDKACTSGEEVSAIFPAFYLSYSKERIYALRFNNLDQKNQGERLSGFFFTISHNGLLLYSAMRRNVYQSFYNYMRERPIKPGYGDHLIASLLVMKGKVMAARENVSVLVRDDSVWYQTDSEIDKDASFYPKREMVLFHDLFWMADLLNLFRENGLATDAYRALFSKIRMHFNVLAERFELRLARIGVADTQMIVRGLELMRPLLEKCKRTELDNNFSYVSFFDEIVAVSNKVLTFFDIDTNTTTSIGSAIVAEVKNDNIIDIPSVDSEVQNVRQSSPNDYVNICVITFNRLDYTKQALESLFAHTDYPHAITVVDNGSTDSSVTYLKDLHASGKIKNLVLLERNVGVAKAANIGWDCEPEAAFYVKYDNDIVMQGPWLADIVDVAKSIPTVGAVGYNVEPYSYPLTQINGKWVRIKQNGNLGGACKLIPVEIHKKLGYWSEEYGLYGEEDADYGYRIIFAGLQNVYMENESLAFHLPAGKAAIINPITFEASDGLEEKVDADYRRWKDQQRKINAARDGLFLNNLIAYRNREKPLYVQTKFVQEWKKKRLALYEYTESTSDIDTSRPETGSARPAQRKVVVYSSGRQEASQQDHYTAWFTHHRWSEQSAKRLKELSSQWSITQKINILIIITDQNQQTLLANTINSIKKQTIDLYRLTVIIDRGYDYSQFSDNTLINWIENDFSNDARQLLMSVDVDSESDWLLLCEPGTCFEPVFCNLFSELVNKNPEWRFVYTDEDVIDDKGVLSKPSFKPDSNLDLLRSCEYVGHACLIHSELWRKISSIERTSSCLLINYVAALRCHESFGEKAFGHIDEILFHHPLEIVDDLQEVEELGKFILQKHLQGQGIFAEVTPGLVKGSFFVDYLLLGNSLISIIIPTKNRLDLLQPCIESLLEKTLYSNYELIIIDNHSDDPTTLEYLTELPIRDQRIKIIPYLKEYNYSAINNFAAQHARGDFLLLLNNDTVIIQDNWLERMLAIGLREDVGAVGCRLVYVDQKIQHAGVILGLCGVAEHIGIGSSMNDTGYMGRAQLTQNFSAVTAACMLIRKSLFFDVGGLDEKDFAVLYNDIDLCLKVRERGYRIVWTPFVTLVHHGNSSLNANPDTKRDALNLQSRKAFIKKWHALLGNDPAYNRHLSLRQREWAIDGDFDVPWHPDLEPLPRIVAQPPDEMGVGQYRLIGPLKELTNKGRICSFLLPALSSEKRFLPYVSELVRAKPTVLFLQNAFTHFHLDDLQGYAESLPDVFRVFGQDDIVFSVPQKSAARKHFGKDTKARVRRAVSLCHRAIVTTESIAEAMRGMVDDIRVVPNYLERSLWENLQPPRKERRKLRVGWAGAQQHQGDLEFILPVVEATANEVDWIFMGLCPPKLRYHVAEAHNAVPFDRYPAALAALDLDLAIAPLEINRFNTAKSNLRLLEYGALGYPVIATDILPYRNAPVTRVPNNPKAWIDTIRAHVHDLDATRAAGQQLHEWVLSNWMLDQHLDKWIKALLPN